MELVILAVTLIAGAWFTWYAEKNENRHMAEAEKLAKESMKKKKKKSTRNW